MRLKEIKPGMVIHCKTEEEARFLRIELDKLGYRWVTNQPLEDSTIWKKYDNICLHIQTEGQVTWSEFEDAKSENYTITEFSDLIIPELSAKEVLEVVRELCVDRGCDDCIFYHNHCPFSKEYGDLDKVIDICTKWREEHPKEEKKELETEWVYVVRIIKVHDNGKKECVHEVDGYASSDDVGSPFSESEELAECELKDYVANHEGNFFATLEHICRIKE